MRCTATIEVDGKVHQCERNTGDEHFPREVRHEVKISAPDGQSGLSVTWSTWRMTKPCATGGGQS